MKWSRSLPRFCVVILLIFKLPRNSERSGTRSRGKCEPFPHRSAADTLISLSQTLQPSWHRHQLISTLFDQSHGPECGAVLVIRKQQTGGEVSVRHFCCVCCDWGRSRWLPTYLDGWACHLLAAACLDVPVLHRAIRWRAEIPASVCRRSAGSGSPLFSEGSCRSPLRDRQLGTSSKICMVFLKKKKKQKDTFKP